MLEETGVLVLVIPLPTRTEEEDVRVVEVAVVEGEVVVPVAAPVLVVVVLVLVVGEEVVLVEVPVVVGGSPGRVVDVLLASGRGMLTEGGGGTFVGRRVFGGLLITGGPAHTVRVEEGFAGTVVVTVTVAVTVTC